MEIKMVPVEELKHAEYNPRKLTREDFQHIKESIEKFGFVENIVVNSAPGREGVIIGGNQRFEVAKALGHKEVPVFYVNIDDLKREKELNIRLNRASSEWDFDLLANNYEEEDLLAWGFKETELGKYFEDDSEEENPVPDPPQIARAQVGAVYTLGKHRLMCADSTVRENVEMLMGGEKADMVFTDPPYDFIFNRETGGAGFGTSGKGDYGMERFPELDEWMPLAISVLKDDCAFLCFEHWRNTLKVWNAMERHGLTVKNLIIWHATNRFSKWASGYFFNKFDIILAGSKGKKLPIRVENCHGMVTDHIESPVASTKESGQDVIYGTKPQAILQPYLKALTDKNNIVYEPYCGSGSTLIACENSERNCFGMELNPKHVDVIIQRFCNHTGANIEEIYESGKVKADA